MAYGIVGGCGVPNHILDSKVDKKTMETELAKKANATHVHSANDVTSGTLPIADC